MNVNMPSHIAKGIKKTILLYNYCPMHSSMYRAMINKSPCCIKSMWITLSRVDLSTKLSSRITCYSVCCTIRICPGDCVAYINRDSSRVKSKILYCYLMCRSSCIVSPASWSSTASIPPVSLVPPVLPLVPELLHPAPTTSINKIKTKHTGMMGFIFIVILVVRNLYIFW